MKIDNFIGKVRNIFKNTNPSLVTHTPEQLEELHNRLNSLGRDVFNRFKRINHGGCCIYATMIVRELQRQNIECGGIAIGENNFDLPKIDTVRKKIKKHTASEWNNNGISLNHVAVEFVINGKKYHYDTTGVRLAGSHLHGKLVYEGRFTFAEMQTMSKQGKNCWNHMFDRKNIPAIRVMVEKALRVDKTSRKVL